MQSSVSYRVSLIASYLGYVTQAIAINFLPLLFATFQREFSVSLEQLGLLVTASFVVQMAVDLLATRFGDRLGYRVGAVAAHVFAVAGLVALAFLPGLLPVPYVGLMIGTVLMAIGGGLIEVLISPIVDAMPFEGKARVMTLLHSFFSWGFLAVVLLSTAFFALFGTENWRWLALFWAAVPLVTGVLFCFVPLPAPKGDQGGSGAMLKRLFATPVFWVFMLLMLCAGATEIAASQWASLFAEVGLGVPKAVGDLLGPCAFALLMGMARVFFASSRRAAHIRRSLFWCGAGCIIGYVLIVACPWPFVSLAGFGVCGFCVGVMWPGVLSLGAEAFPTGGTAMFSLLALCGDVGCSIGPGLVGALSNTLQGAGLTILTALKCGLAAATLFPVLLVVAVGVLRRRHRLDELS